VRGTNMPALKPSAAAEARIRRLLRMLAALEEAIIRLEARGDGDRERLVERLRALQDDIATALGLDDPGTTRRPDRRTNY
jgi:hypothetical protein